MWWNNQCAIHLVYTSSVNLSSQERFDFITPNDLTLVDSHSWYAAQAQAVDSFHKNLPTSLVPQLT